MSSKNNPGVAIVTGAARGIGAMIVRRLVRDGYAVVANDISTSSDVHDLVAELVRSGGKAIAVTGDVSKTTDVQRLYDVAEEQFGQPDVVVSNAGILKLMPLAETSDEVFAQTFAINVGGAFNMLREAATRVKDGGRIITLSSTSLAVNMPGYSIYNGTKAAVEAFTRVLSKELRGRRITVNCVAPGPVDTHLFTNGKTAEQIKQFSLMPPLERLGQTEDVANAVAFLAGPDGSWINGQVLRSNGGLA